MRMRMSRHGVALLGMALSLGVAVGTGHAGGIPEPGLTMYGVIRNDIGGATVRMTSGTLRWTVVPPSGPVVTTEVALTNINDQFSYVIDIPFETAIAGEAATSNALQMAATVRTFNRAQVLVGTNVATIAAPAGTTFMFSQADRANVERVDLTLAARDPDVDGDGIPDWWETEFFGCATCANAGDDSGDVDGVNNLDEYLAGTDPLDDGSRLAFVNVARQTGGGYTVEWSSEPGRYYRVARSQSLLTGFAPLATGILATPPKNTYVDTTATGPAAYFYRVEME